MEGSTSLERNIPTRGLQWNISPAVLFISGQTADDTGAESGRDVIFHERHGHDDTTLGWPAAPSQVSYASCRLILDRSPPDRCSPSTYTSHLHTKLINNCRQTSLRFEVVDTSTRDRRGELLSHRNELHCMAPSCGRLCILIPPSQIQSRLSSAAGFILRVRIGDAVKRNLSKASFDVVSV